MNRRRPLAWLQARIDAWVLARVRRQPGPFTVQRSRIYILPTRFGWAYAALLLVMLLGAMNYGNSMAFLLCFLLAGLGFVTMHHTHANLANLQLRGGIAPPVFAGEPARFQIIADNPSAQPRYSLVLGAARRDSAQESRADLPAHGQALLELTRSSPRRGWLAAPALRLSTEYPLGLFRAWTLAELELSTLVFPQPAAPGRAIPASIGGSGSEASRPGGHDDFSGLRSYQHGDSARTIHWKSLPKALQPMVKQFADVIDRDCWLDWDALEPLPAEARLSQLTRWVLDAEHAQQPYGLRLPGLSLAPGHGDAHRLQCLKALALFEAT